MTKLNLTAPKVAPLNIPARRPNGHWEFHKEMGNGVGFIYIIYDSYMNRAYLGRKSYTKSVGGRQSPSDWKTYTGSSKVLASLIDARGVDAFQFLCLDEYKTKSGLNWAETFSLVHARIPHTPKWYNELIPEVAHRTKEHPTERHMNTLNTVLGLLGFKDGRYS